MREALQATLGVALETLSPVGGGDINDAFRARLADGRELFVKTNRCCQPTMFLREAEGLAWLAEADAVRIPEVVAHGAQFLALEWIEQGTPSKDHDEVLGRALAALHRSGAESFGWVEDNFIGTLSQDNTSEPDWPSFYRLRRLAPQVRDAHRSGYFDAAICRSFDTLYARLEELVGEHEPPSRVHGDLWGGNRHVASDGAPVLIDPAVYGGHREMDLAMMRLFGGYSSRVFAAYEEAWPLAPGVSDRVPLYQLYPLLTHVNLFGRSYVASVEGALSKVL